MAIGKEDYVTPKSGYMVKKEGEFDPDEFYRVVTEWYERRHYTFTEKENTEKLKSHGNDLNLKLFGDREVDDYAQYFIEVYAIVYELRKGDTYTGKMKLTVKAFIDLDYKGGWQGTPFTRFLFNIYNNYIIKKRIKDGYEDDLEEDVKELFGEIKKVINMHD